MSICRAHICIFAVTPRPNQPPARTSHECRKMFAVVCVIFCVWRRSQSYHFHRSTQWRHRRYVIAAGRPNSPPFPIFVDRFAQSVRSLRRSRVSSKRKRFTRKLQISHFRLAINCEYLDAFLANANLFPCYLCFVLFYYCGSSVHYRPIY